MAKLKAPLLSLGASGKFADTMVFFDWKGIPVVRQLVYPAQPRPPAVVAQRLHIANAIAEAHLSLFTEEDQSAYERLAGTRATSQTGPNQMTREYVRVARVPDTWSRLRAGGNIPAGGFDRELRVYGDAALVGVKVRYGTNIRFMNTIQTCIWDAVLLRWEYSIPLGSFNSGDRVYFQFYDSATTIDVALGVTGIYYFDMP